MGHTPERLTARDCPYPTETELLTEAEPRERWGIVEREIAAELVRRYNAHDDLLAACEAALRRSTDTSPLAVVLRAAIEKATPDAT